MAPHRWRINELRSVRWSYLLRLLFKRPSKTFRRRTCRAQCPGDGCILRAEKDRAERSGDGRRRSCPRGRVHPTHIISIVRTRLRHADMCGAHPFMNQKIAKPAHRISGGGLQNSEQLGGILNSSNSKPPAKQQGQSFQVIWMTCARGPK